MKKLFFKNFFCCFIYRTTTQEFFFFFENFHFFENFSETKYFLRDHDIINKWINIFNHININLNKS